MLVGHAGYETFGSEVSSDFLESYAKSPAVTAARIVVALTVATSLNRAETLGASLSSANQVAEARAEELEVTRDQAFQATATLAKLLLNTRRRPENVLVQELYEELKGKDVPVSEWPNWVMMRMSGGETTLSAWL